MKKMYNGDIPFEVSEKENRQLHYPETWSRTEVIWKPNHRFSAKLEFDNHYGRGQSAAYFYATLFDVECSDTEFANFLDGKQVVLFMTDLSDILITAKIENGKTDALDFMFSKRGQNYGITLVKGQ